MERLRDKSAIINEKKKANRMTLTDLYKQAALSMDRKDIVAGNALYAVYKLNGGKKKMEHSKNMCHAARWYMLALRWKDMYDRAEERDKRGIGENCVRCANNAVGITEDMTMSRRIKVNPGNMEWIEKFLDDEIMVVILVSIKNINPEAAKAEVNKLKNISLYINIRG